MNKENKLTTEDLPDDLLGQIKEAIGTSPAVLKLKQQRNAAILRHNYVEVQRISLIIHETEQQIINSFLSQYAGEAEQMCDLMKGMEGPDVENLVNYVNGIMLLCDMIDTFTMECNEILHKYHPDYNIEMFNKVIAVGREAREHIRFMGNCTDWDFQTSFADVGDNLTELVLNKSRALARKVDAKKRTV